MASFDSTAFDTDAFDGDAFDFDGVVVLDPGGTFRRARWSWKRVARWKVNTLAADELTKTESDDRDFLFDLQAAPEVVAGATCSSGEIVGEDPTGLTFGTPAALADETDGIPAGEGMSVRISGGSDDTTYAFALKVTLSSGRVLTVPARMVVVSDNGS